MNQPEFDEIKKYSLKDSIKIHVWVNNLSVEIDNDLIRNNLGMIELKSIIQTGDPLGPKENVLKFEKGVINELGKLLKFGNLIYLKTSMGFDKKSKVRSHKGLFWDMKKTRNNTFYEHAILKNEFETCITSIAFVNKDNLDEIVKDLADKRASVLLFAPEDSSLYTTICETVKISIAEIVDTNGWIRLGKIINVVCPKGGQVILFDSENGGHNYMSLNIIGNNKLFKKYDFATSH